jgi:hypothetical protein
MSIYLENNDFDGSPILNDIESILVVNAYPNDLHVAWTIEYTNMIKNLYPNLKIKILEIGMKSFCNDRKFLVFLRHLFLGIRSNYLKLIDEIFKKRDVEIRMATRQFMFKKTFNGSIKMILNLRVQNMLNVDLDSRLVKSIHSSLANRLETVYYVPILHPVLIFKRVASYYHAYHSVQKELLRSNYQQIVVGNGRFPNSAGAAAAGLDVQKRVIFLERGGSPGMFNVFERSPHSVLERATASNRLWSKVPSKFKEIAEEIAITYIIERSKFDPVAGRSWLGNQRKILPSTSFESKKKICVFYSSTELEFAVFDDHNEENIFKNQEQAITALCESLESNKWQIFIRRHPAKKNYIKDNEKKLWKNISKFKNVVIIEPNSKIDSYELAMRADLVCHYNSSMGPECILLGAKKILTLGTVFWESTSTKNNNPLNKQQLIDSLEDHNIDVLGRRMDAIKWGYYSSVAGRKFQLLEWKNRKIIYKSRIISKRNFHQVIS